jgi:hypothetical protein|eukprot:CAMPEP_0168313552 /NCGR_PEP_ID=MMETSP0210-20121227/2649_1 /TAXON_ID=40633 /ORGANISM="Condylostoma magnum, Strain COL2" /LENGTH=48 /DNA_ID= /DNA_START= /DNA_END= /DNA_ORIENTATION=
MTIAEDIEKNTDIELFIPRCMSNPTTNASFFLISAIYEGVVTFISDTD